MAAHAVTKVSNPFFEMFARHFGLVVAGVTGPCGQVWLVAVGAGVDAASFLSVIHGEGVRAGVLRRAPGGGGMALRAGLAGEHARVIGRLAVTGGAFGGRAFEDPVLVAALAFYGDVRAGEREAAQVVVEGGVFPVGGGVADFAGHSKLSIMCIVFFVAGVTCGWRAFELFVLVAAFALDGDVFSFQLEAREVVVERDVFP